MILCIAKPVVFCTIWTVCMLITNQLAQKIEGFPILKKKYGVLGSILIVITSGFVVCLDLPLWEIILYAVFLGIEFIAASMDARYKNVYSILHIGALFPLLPLIIIKKPFIGGLVFFLVLQVIMCLTYGVSDMMAFDLMGIFYTLLLVPQRTLDPFYINAFNEFITLLIPMLIAYISAVIYQLKKKNLNKFGNCKEASPFIPEIYLATCCCLILRNIA